MNQGVLGDKITNVKEISEVENGPTDLEMKLTQNVKMVFGNESKGREYTNIKGANEVKAEPTEVADEVSALLFEGTVSRRQLGEPR